MPLYEHVFLARQDVTAQQVETMVETYKGVLEANGGKVEKIEMWGVKSLAYRIKKNRKAHFTLLNIDAPPAALTGGVGVLGQQGGGFFDGEESGGHGSQPA